MNPDSARLAAEWSNLIKEKEGIQEAVHYLKGNPKALQELYDFVLARGKGYSRPTWDRYVAIEDGYKIFVVNVDTNNHHLKHPTRGRDVYVRLGRSYHYSTTHNMWARSFV